MKAMNLLLVLLLFSSLSFAQESQSFLALKSTGVEDFIKQHPEYDGKGTIIIVLDTGVDMGIDGLLKTSGGEVKVIDVQDFTGEGEMEYYSAERRKGDDKIIFENPDKNFSVKADIGKLIPSADDNYFIGAFPENHLINSNSGSADLNGNGSTNDVYYFIVYKTIDQFWVVYFDQNGNGDLSDEKPLRNYKEKFDAFTIQRAKGLAPFTIALNIFPEENKVVFFFDDGSHGTHCAGIAAGYNIGEAGINGVAPGAKIIALKIGHNNFPGGATVNESMKKAYLYADKISREREEPCIISMSYGIGSEIENRSEMENFLAKLLNENPYLYVSVSNGNEGPGISSSGLPASSNYVFSSGAVLAKEVARDNYGNDLPKDIILHFSSRGGEVTKPDVISPGAATSTVPNFTAGDKFWGTSMACPYSAGVMSLLLSAARKEYPDVKIPAQLLYKIIRESATKWDEYTVLDQGGGFINVLNAYDLLKKFLNNGEHKNFETYTIGSFAPNQPDNKSNNLYIRDGSFLTGDEVFAFTIKRENTINSDKFYRKYSLKTDADWIKLIQKKTYIRNDQPVIVNVKTDKTKLGNPGLYTAKIIATRDDATAFPEFEMIATVVIPYEFNSTNNYRMMWKDEIVQQGMIKRYFIKIPAGQNSMKITLSRDKMSKKYSRCRYFLHNNDGIQVDVSQVLYSVNNDEKIERYYFDLTPGIYEIIVDGFFLASEPSVYNLEVEFNSINRIGSEPLSEDKSSIELVNYFNETKTYNLSGKIIGLKKNYFVRVDGNTTLKIPFKLIRGQKSKEFSFELTKEDFNKVTDFSFQILDTSGKAVSKNALSYRSGGNVSIEIPEDKDSIEYVLELVPAFVSKELSAKVKVNEIIYFPSTLSVDVKCDGKTSVTLYPNNIKKLDVKFPNPVIDYAEDYTGFGKIYFNSPTSNKIEYELPINFKY